MIRGKKGLYNPWRSYTCRPKPGGKAQNWRIGDRRWKCRLGEDGLSSELSGTGPLALTLPAFDFDGEGATEIACDGRALSVSYKGWTCRYSTDGEIVDMDAPVSNRNGRYRVFEARGRDSLKVHISIFSEKGNNENKGGGWTSRCRPEAGSRRRMGKGLVPHARRLRAQDRVGKPPLSASAAVAPRRALLVEYGQDGRHGRGGVNGKAARRRIP